MRAVYVFGIVSVFVLASCSVEDRRLRDMRTFSGEPEEFSIVPRKPLQPPQDLDALPEPTPGGANRTDQTPLADAVLALGGNPAAGSAGGVPLADQALVSEASRFGRDAQVRETLAQEDDDFRKRQRFTWQLFPDGDPYTRVYRRQTLNPYDWLRRSRDAGATTPTAPPEN